MRAMYRYSHAGDGYAHSYLFGPVLRILRAQPARRIFEVGCGNGSLAKRLEAEDFEVSGVDSSESGIALAGHPRLRVGSAYDDLAAQYGRFPIVLSLEVVEHLYDPRRFARTVFDLLEPNGIAIISTPFHSYWKNLAISLAGKWDAHHDPLWDDGHIKFWSERTLTDLLREAGFERIEFVHAGRIRPLAKSMIATAHVVA
jgi:2-polyprenyl-3-methyl-5-hydroxy-6-metoxy-1,4-benzoquinol methylase